MGNETAYRKAWKRKSVGNYPMNTDGRGVLADSGVGRLRLLIQAG